MLNRLVVLAGVVILLMAVGLGAQPTYENAVEGANNATTVTNETFTASTGEHTLAESNRDVVYSDTATVTQNDTTIQPAGNYSWNTADGTIEVLSGTTLNTSETALVTYEYTVPDGEQQLARDVTLAPAEAGGATTAILGAFLLLGSIMIVVRVVS